MGLIKPTSGKVIINGYDVEKDSEKAIEKQELWQKHQAFMEDYQDIKILFLWLIYMVFLKKSG